MPMFGDFDITTGLFLPRGSKKKRRRGGGGRDVGASLRINPPKQIRRKRSFAGCLLFLLYSCGGLGEKRVRLIRLFAAEKKCAVKGGERIKPKWDTGFTVGNILFVCMVKSFL